MRRIGHWLLGDLGEDGGHSSPVAMEGEKVAHLRLRVGAGESRTRAAICRSHFSDELLTAMTFPVGQLSRVKPQNEGFGYIFDHTGSLQGLNCQVCRREVWESAYKTACVITSVKGFQNLISFPAACASLWIWASAKWQKKYCINVMWNPPRGRRVREQGHQLSAATQNTQVTSLCKCVDITKMSTAKPG